jgi:hypothetical protein
MLATGGCVGEVNDGAIELLLSRFAGRATAAYHLASRPAANRPWRPNNGHRAVKKTATNAAYGVK